ncbi:DUF943 family protein [Pseudomonas graminis]
MVKKTKIRVFILLLVMVLGGVLLWFSFRQVKVIAVHQDGTYSDILVENYPLTDEGKIKWWLENKDFLKVKYNIPRPDEDGRYHVILWGFGEGYKEDDGYDSLCFDDVKPPKNCVDKDSLLIISRDKYKVTEFNGDGGIYVLQDNGLIVKRR